MGPLNLKNPDVFPLITVGTSTNRKNFSQFYSVEVEVEFSEEKIGKD